MTIQIFQTSAPIYLDLSGALAAFGLIFAVYQLRKPRWEIVLLIRNNWQRRLFWVFGGTGLLLTLIRVLLSGATTTHLPHPFNALLFYEILAYLFFIASPLSLIYFSNKLKGLFNIKNSRKFYEIIVQEISGANNDRINAVLDVLLNNFETICKVIQKKQDDETNQSARAIFDVVLSDDYIVKILTTKRLDALRYIFITIEKFNISNREVNIGVYAIIKNLFYDKESFFYKHLKGNGLALSSNIYDDIFNSKTILTNFNLFGYPATDYLIRKKLDLIGIEVFLEALSRSIKSYLKTNNIPARHINEGLSYLNEIFSDLCFKISTEDKRGIDTEYILKDEWWSLRLIAKFLGHDYQFLAYNESLNKDVAEREKTASEAEFYSNSTINSGIAAALYKAFEQLSYIKKSNNVYNIVIELLHGMIYEEKLKEGYRGPFEKRIWEQIGNNVINRYYPAVLPVYLLFIGFYLVSDYKIGQGWISEQAEKMRRLLYFDLKPLLDKNTKMINDKNMKDVLLPQLMDYKNEKFIYKLEFGQGSEEVIIPPTGKEESALQGVDLKHRSSL